MAVTVSSKMDKSEPFALRPRMVSVSSKFRRVEASRGITSPFSITRREEMCWREFFWVSLKYRISAPAA